jgi:hypothetical protein
VKLTKDRLWCLKQFGFGWSSGRGDWLGVKKWDAHKAALIKAGLLEKDEYGLFRITDAGRKALEGKE